VTDACGSVRRAAVTTTAHTATQPFPHAPADRALLVTEARDHLAAGGSILLTGPAGIGKSTLMATLTGDFGDHQVLRCSLSEAERHLPFLGTSIGGLDAHNSLGPLVHWFFLLAVGARTAPSTTRSTPRGRRSASPVPTRFPAPAPASPERRR
jgi:hypothetical protein